MINHPRISSLSHISSHIYLDLLQNIFSIKPLDIISDPASPEDEAHNVQCVIDTLSFDILGISLSHITGEDVVSKKPLAIYHILQIMEKYARTASSVGSPNGTLKSGTVLNSSVVTTRSSASQQNVFCLLCEYSKAKENFSVKKVVSSVTGVMSSDHSCSMHSQGHSQIITSSSTSASETTSTMTESMDSSFQTPEKHDSSKGKSGKSVSIQESIPRTAGRTSQKRKRENSGQSFNCLLTQKLIKTLEETSSTPQKDIIQEGMRDIPCRSPLDTLYKSVFRSRIKVKTPPVSKTSVLLPRYLRRNVGGRKSKSPYRKTPLRTQLESRNEGILKEIQSALPGIQITREGLNQLSKIHQNQVKYISNQMPGKTRTSATNKLYQENISKQLQLNAIAQKDQEEQSRLIEQRELNNIAARTRGALRDSNIQKARTKRLFDQYYTQHHRKMSIQKDREKVLLKQLYKDRLSLQRQQVQFVKRELKEQEEQEVERHRNKIASMNNFYEGCLDLFKESAQDCKAQKEAQIKAQSRTLEQTRRGILKQIEKETKEIQENLERRDDFFFQEENAERLRESWTKP